MDSIYYFTYGVTGLEKVGQIILAARDHDIKRIKELLSSTKDIINDIGPVRIELNYCVFGYVMISNPLE